MIPRKQFIGRSFAQIEHRIDIAVEKRLIPFFLVQHFGPSIEATAELVSSQNNARKVAVAGLPWGLVVGAQ